MFTEDSSNAIVVRRCVGDAVHFSDNTIWHPPFAIYGQTRIQHWFDGDINALSVTDFSFCLHTTPPAEICLLATGEQTVLPPPALAAALYQQRVAVEAMRLDAACRLYTLLLAEQRHVAFAALAFPR